MADDNQVKSKNSSIQEVKQQVVDKIATLMTSAFGLVAALAWNSAIEKIFSTVFGSISEIYAQVMYAVTVTIIAVIVTIYIGRIAARLK